MEAQSHPRFAFKFENARFVFFYLNIDFISKIALVKTDATTCIYAARLHHDAVVITGNTGNFE